MDYSRQENWSGLPFPTPRDLLTLNLQIESMSLVSPAFVGQFYYCVIWEVLNINYKM